MRSRARTLIPAMLLAATFAASSAMAQAGSLLVQVTALENGAPVAGAQVKVDGAARGVTDAGGVLRLPSVAVGRRRLEVAALGRKPRAFAFDVPAGEPAEVEVRLAADAVPVAGVRAAAQPRARPASMGGFYRRAGGNVGHFITREEIDA